MMNKSRLKMQMIIPKCCIQTNLNPNVESSQSQIESRWISTRIIARIQIESTSSEIESA